MGRRVDAALLAAEVRCQGALAVIAGEDSGNERLSSLQLATSSACYAILTLLSSAAST